MKPRTIEQIISDLQNLMLNFPYGGSIVMRPVVDIKGNPLHYSDVLENTVDNIRNLRDEVNRFTERATIELNKYEVLRRDVEALRRVLNPAVRY